MELRITVVSETRWWFTEENPIRQSTDSREMIQWVFEGLEAVNVPQKNITSFAHRNLCHIHAQVTQPIECDAMRQNVT